MSEAILVVDVQPAYQSAMGGSMLSALMQHLNHTDLPVLAMWVGCGLTSDTVDEVQDFMIRHGLSEDRVNEVRFIEKDYSSLRPWMDLGVAHDVIVKVASAMIQRNVTSSELLDLEALLDEDELETLPRSDQIHAPDFSGNERLLRSFEHLQLCGGGRDECLKEVELYLEASSRNYSVLDHFVY